MLCTCRRTFLLVWVYGRTILIPTWPLSRLPARPLPCTWEARRINITPWIFWFTPTCKVGARPKPSASMRKSRLFLRRKSMVSTRAPMPWRDFLPFTRSSCIIGPRPPHLLRCRIRNLEIMRLPIGLALSAPRATVTQPRLARTLANLSPFTGSCWPRRENSLPRSSTRIGKRRKLGLHTPKARMMTPLRCCVSSPKEKNQPVKNQRGFLPARCSPICCST